MIISSISLLVRLCNALYSEYNREINKRLYPQKGVLRNTLNYRGISFSTVTTNPKSRRIVKIRMAFGEIVRHFYRFWQSIKSSKKYIQKPQGNTTVHRFLLGFWSHTKKRWRKYYLHMVFPKKLLPLSICFAKTRKQGFANQTLISSALALESCKEIPLRHTAENVEHQLLSSKKLVLQREKMKRLEAGDILHKQWKTKMI